MTTETIIANTKQMIDNLKTVCANFGLGNASSEYKIITEIFLYKFLNDKFLYEVQQADKTLKDSANVEKTLNDMSDDDYEMLMMLLPPATAKLKRKHFISYLFNHKNDEKFNKFLEYPRVIWAKQKIMKQIQIGLCFFVEVVYNRIVINLPRCW